MIQLQHYTTFGNQAKAQQLVEINSKNQLVSFLEVQKRTDNSFMILGSGSNILFTKDYEGTILKNNLKGIVIEKEDENHVWVNAAGGEIWHDLVMYCVNNGWGGIENLALIPGTVGAAPMQNIGAYGVEIKETFDSLEAINLSTAKTETFNNAQCAFGYRESIFKTKVKGQYFITSLTLKLSKKPNVNTAYGDIENRLNEWNITQPSIADVSNAVIAIRQSKLPDPSVLGNAGSFFKNPVIGNDQFQILQKKYPAIKFFPTPDAKIKIPAAWLIEQTGWKGKRFGNVGVHEHQALVLVNYGGATGHEIINLANEIIASVHEKFGIILKPEVNIV